MKKQIRTFLQAALLAAVLSPAAALAADTYEIDAVHSHALYKIKHLNVGYQYGRFKDMKGMVVVDEKTPANSKVEVVIPTASVDSNHPKRDEHLKSPDFFDATKYPTLTFKSTQVKKLSADTYEVLGNLTLRGVTKPIKFKFKKTGEGKGMQGEYRLGGEATLTIKRSDFGIKYGLPDVLNDQVDIILAFEGVKQ